MKPTERIIRLIEEGDPIPLLADTGVVDCFNELLRYELIDIVNEKVILTQKGEQAKTVGLDQFLHDLKTKEELKDFSPEIQVRENFKFKWSLAICLSLVALFIVVSLTNCTVNL